MAVTVNRALRSRGRTLIFWKRLSGEVARAGHNGNLPPAGS
ncbi:hypothetical protein BOSE21B_90700 [Bosea sp. 21B]|nr:hypothetical protein BOSE21B_90700 [Bosea sp. 21B]